MREAKETKAGITNALRVIQEVCYHDDITRPEIAKAIHMTTMSVTNIVNDLFARDILIEDGSNTKNTRCGRKPRILDFSPRAPHILSIHFGRRDVIVAEMDFKARIVNEAYVSLEGARSREAVWETVFPAIDRVLAEASSRICAMGLASFGPVETVEGYIVKPTAFLRCEKFELRKPIEERYGLPLFIVDNCNASALAEKRYGRMSHIDSFCYIRLYAGIGCGFVINGTVFKGVSGMSGQIGQITMDMNGGAPSPSGKRGLLDSVLDVDRMIETINRERGRGKEPLTWNEALGKFTTDETFFPEMFREITHCLAIAISDVVALLDLDTFIIDYPGQESGDRIERAIEDEVRRYTNARRSKMVSVYKSTFGIKAILKGACSIVLDELLAGHTMNNIQ